MEEDKSCIVVSACLLGKPVRYDGEFKGEPIIIELAKFVNIIPVCPETAIGLPSPRPRVFLWQTQDGKILIIQEGTKKDITPEIERFCEKFLESVKNKVIAFILKSKSPSCSPTPTTKMYQDKEGKICIGKERGILGKMIIKKFPHLPVFDERELKSEKGKEFLLKLFEKLPESIERHFKNI